MERNPLPLAEPALLIRGAVRPGRGVEAEPHHAMKRKRPGPDALHMAVFDRVEVDVIEMPREIVFVAQRVFPRARCQTPRSRLRRRLAEMPSVWGNPREKLALISRQRTGKSPSPPGNVQIVCRWSGSTTMASMTNGCPLRA